MTEIAEAARAVVVVADAAQAEANGKIYAMGMGWHVTALTPAGMSPPQAVMAMFSVPRRFAGSQVAVELGLYDETGEIVHNVGPDGSTQKVRAAQVAVMQPLMAQSPAIQIPQSTDLRGSMIFSGPAGFALAPGQAYQWRFSLDGHHDPDWTATFFVLSAAPGPVFG